MSHDGFIGHENPAGHPPVPPGVLLRAKADKPPAKGLDTAATERIEHGHENLRKEAFAAVLREIDESRGVIVFSAQARREMAKVVADFAMAVLDLDSKKDSTLPVKASVEGYKKSLEVARKKVSDRIRQIVSDSWEKWES